VEIGGVAAADGKPGGLCLLHLCLTKVSCACANSTRIRLRPFASLVVVDLAQSGLQS